MKQTNKRVQALYAFTKLARALTALSALCQWGDSKWGPGKIQYNKDYKAKQQAHFARYLQGEQYDRESGFDHRLALVFNLLAEIETEQKDVDFEDIIARDLDCFRGVK